MRRRAAGWWAACGVLPPRTTAAAALVLVAALAAAWIDARLDRPFACGVTGGYRIHLSFDDGPAADTTPRILDTLAREGVAASFFVTGRRLDPAAIGEAEGGCPSPGDARCRLAGARVVEQRRALVRRMRHEGHAVGTHAYEHRRHNRWPDGGREGFQTEAEMRRSLRRGKAVVESVLGTPVSFIRLPFGAGTLMPGPGEAPRNARVVEAYRALGLRHIGWHAGARDWSFASAGRRPDDAARQDGARASPLRERLQDKICETRGGILLFHDTYARTAALLPALIRDLRSAGHRLVPLREIAPDCLGPAGPIEYLPDGKLKQCWHVRHRP